MTLDKNKILSNLLI